MFTWICPKCGSEVPPSYSECPKCSAAPAAPAAPAADSQATAPPSPSAHAAVRPAIPVTSAPLPASAAAQRSLSPVTAAVGAAAAMAALLAVLYLFVLPRWTGGGAGEQSANTAVGPLQTPGPAGSSDPAHPMAKHLEIAGLRVTPAKPGTARVQFLVINHSAADLPPMTLDLAVRPRAGGAPVFELPVKLPSIGPYESRELTTTANTALKAYELPDWQAVRADFRLRSE